MHLPKYWPTTDSRPTFYVCLHITSMNSSQAVVVVGVAAFLLFYPLSQKTKNSAPVHKIRQMLIDFQNSFTCRLSSKCVMKDH